MESYFSTTSKNLECIDVHGTMSRLVGKNVNLLNWYKEVPVSYSARLMDYDKDGFAIVMCHPAQARLIDFDRYTILRQGDFSFKASFVSIKEQAQNSSDKPLILLSRFLPAEVYTDMRELVRVVCDNPIDVTISSNGFELTAKMLDLSAASFRTKPIGDLPMGLRDKAQAKFILSSSEGQAQLEAEVMLIKSTSEMQVFKMDTTKALEGVIMRYINQRQVEIIKELNLE